MRDGWLLAAGTLTVARWPAPRLIDRRAAGTAMVVAPLAVVPIGVLAGLAVWLGDLVALPPLVVGIATVALVALGSRALHLDGLSDIADSLTASHERERSLAVLKGGTAGPAGAAALVLVLGVQAASVAALVGSAAGPVVVGGVVCLSRAVLALDCAAGVPAARESGLAVTFAGTVPRVVAVLVWVLVALAAVGLAGAADLPWWRGLVTAGSGLLVAAALLGRCVQRHGGVTGDCFGATIEVGLAGMLAAAAAA